MRYLLYFFFFFLFLIFVHDLLFVSSEISITSALGFRNFQ